MMKIAAKQLLRLERAICRRVANFGAMTARILCLAPLFCCLTSNTSAQQPLILYFNCNFLAGSNLFSEPLLLESNNLSVLFPTSGTNFTYIPAGTTVSLWNPSTSSFDSTATLTNGAWSNDLKLPPGAGALVVAPSPFTNSFTGIVLNHAGSLLTSLNQIYLPPPVFSGPNGIYLLGDKCPVVDVGTNIFLNILGRMPFVGEQVTLLSGTSTYLGNGIWDSVPTLGVGQAAFLNVMAAPPPWLSINCTNNQVTVSWPLSPSSWTLQTNNNLDTGQWGDYAGAVVNNTVTNSQPIENLFFRLSYP